MYINFSTGDFTAAGNITSYSDPRLKEEVTPIAGALDKITSINGVRFRWIDSSVIGKPGSYDYGVLADEIERIAPEIVSDSVHESPDGDHYKVVAYDKLVPFLVEAIKELKAEIEELKKNR